MPLRSAVPGMRSDPRRRDWMPPPMTTTCGVRVRDLLPRHRYRVDGSVAGYLCVRDNIVITSGTYFRPDPGHFTRAYWQSPFAELSYRPQFGRLQIIDGCVTRNVLMFFKTHCSYWDFTTFIKRNGIPMVGKNK